MRRLRNWAAALAGLPETPERVAAAYAVGVALGFSPWLGLHTVLGILVATTFRLNRLAVLLGVWTNLPWIAAPYYAFATWVGMRILGYSQGLRPPVVGLSDLFSEEFWAWLAGQWRLLIPAAVGSQLVAFFLAAFGYLLALIAVRRYREVYGSEWEVSR
ncbi:MAG: hypothetical protein Kow00109_16300 [Acidobacteriota bacterium]